MSDQCTWCGKRVPTKVVLRGPHRGEKTCGGTHCPDPSGAAKGAGDKQIAVKKLVATLQSSRGFCVEVWNPSIASDGAKHAEVVGVAANIARGDKDRKQVLLHGHGRDQQCIVEDVGHACCLVAGDGAMTRLHMLAKVN